SQVRFLYMAGRSRVVAGLEPAGEYRLVAGVYCSIHESFGEFVLAHISVVPMPIAYSSAYSGECVLVVAGVDPLAPILLSILGIAENERGFRRRGVAERFGDDVRRDARITPHDFLWRLHQYSLI